VRGTSDQRQHIDGEYSMTDISVNEDRLYAAVWALLHEAAAKAIEEAERRVERARQAQKDLKEEQKRYPVMTSEYLMESIQELRKHGMI
jgi:hypothetical protein